MYPRPTTVGASSPGVSHTGNQRAGFRTVGSAHFANAWGRPLVGANQPTVSRRTLTDTIPTISKVRGVCCKSGEVRACADVGALSRLAVPGSRAGPWGPGPTPLLFGLGGLGNYLNLGADPKASPKPRISPKH